MEARPIRRTIDLAQETAGNTGWVQRLMLQGSVLADRLELSVFNAGVPVDLAGVKGTAYFKTPEGAVTKECDVSGHAVCVEFPPEAYAYEGTLVVIVFLEDGKRNVPLYREAFDVGEGHGEILIDPDDIIPDLSAVMDMMKQVEEAADAASLAAENALESLPYVGENQNWYVYDAQTKAHEDTGITARGLSAYEVAVRNGFEGTEMEWLESIKMQSYSFAVSTIGDYWWANSSIIITSMEPGWLNNYSYVDITFSLGDEEMALAAAKALFVVSAVDKAAGTITIKRLGEPFRGDPGIIVRVVK